MEDNKKRFTDFNKYVSLYKNSEGKMQREISNWDLAFGKDKEDYNRYLKNYLNILKPNRVRRVKAIPAKNDAGDSYINMLKPKWSRRPDKNDRGDS